MPEPFYDPLHIAWAAGVIEGEGSFSVRFRRKSTVDDRQYYGFRVRVVMTDLDVVERVRDVFRCGHMDSYANTGGLGTKRLYRWDVSRAEDVRAVCTVIYPFMGKRRKAQIDHVLRMLVDYPPTTTAERVRRMWLVRKARTPK
jgi:hypothetical protein